MGWFFCQFHRSRDWVSAGHTYHVVQRARGLEAELLLGKRRVRGQVRHIAWAATDDLVRVVVASDLAHSIDHVEHTHADTLAEVESTVLAVFLLVHKLGVVVERDHRIQVALGEVENVDVVTHTRAVGGGVVVAEHLETRLAVLAHSHVRQEREQVARLSARVLANVAGRVGTSRAASVSRGTYLK